MWFGTASGRSCRSSRTFCQASLSSRRLTQNRGTADTQNYSLSVTEHRGDLVATCKNTRETLGKQKSSRRSSVNCVTWRVFAAVLCKWALIYLISQTTTTSQCVPYLTPRSQQRQWKGQHIKAHKLGHF